MKPVVVRQFQVVVMSRRFAALARELPEIQHMGSIQIDGKTLEGPRVILVTYTIDEIEEKFDQIVTEARQIMEDPFIKVLYRQGHCYKCSDGASCTHFDEIATMNSSFQITSKEDIVGIRAALSQRFVLG
jgi:hypothetical protein